MTLPIFHRGLMQFTFKKFITSIFVLAAFSLAMSVYSASHITTQSTPDATQFNRVSPSVKVENISLDYSNAHIGLMKKPDEAMVSTF
jgi:hypothetical protein